MNLGNLLQTGKETHVRGPLSFGSPSPEIQNGKGIPVVPHLNEMVEIPVVRIYLDKPYQ